MKFVKNNKKRGDSNAEIAEISAEKTENKLRERGMLRASLGGEQRERRAQRKHPANSGTNSTR
jgi:hypothetical protein